jgi:large subunit ribosomal protein L24
MGQMRKRHEAGTFKPHVKKGDQVLVLAGRSLGEQGRIASVEPQRERAIVEGINLSTKHQRSRGMGRSAAAAKQQSGRIERPSPIHLSNLMVICPSCNTPTRITHKQADNRWVRVCRRCGEFLDRTEE